MQPVDYTTLTALCWELRQQWLPARLEQVYQRDRHTIAIALRTLQGRGWLNVCWHPQAAHLSIGTPPPREPDTFTFSQQLQHQLNGLALIAMTEIAPWERAIDLQFARRPGDEVLWHLYLEIMGKYSNAILVNREGIIVTAAHQVSPQQSSVRPILTGELYEPPPLLLDPIPTPTESLTQWRDRVSLIPGPIKRNLLKSYRGLSSALAIAMLQMADLEPEQPTPSLPDEAWQRLFDRWQEWLLRLGAGKFEPGYTEQGYNVLGWQVTHPTETIQQVVAEYYGAQLNQQRFNQLHHQLSQKLKGLLEKLQHKAAGFRLRLGQSDQAELYREQADLLMAYLHQWEPGMKTIVLPDFDSGADRAIELDPEKNAVQNAQALYKQHQKLKRARLAVLPLLTDVEAEIQYLEQVDAALAQLESYQTTTDLSTLEEIRDELVQQGYLTLPDYRGRSSSTSTEIDFYRYPTPSGFEVWIGRNNRQNDQLTFRLAGDYDLWFHTQEIPGSHVLLRLKPGSVPEDTDLQFTADLTAYYSRARLSEQVPVVYTEPRYVFKPKGAKPGIAIYKQERILWGQPQKARKYLEPQ